MRILDTKQPISLRIIIDNEDVAAGDPQPFTLNVFNDAIAGAAYEPLVLNGGGGAILARSIPEALRQLASEIEHHEVEFDPFA